MELRKVTRRIVFSVAAIVVVGSVSVSCSNEDFEELGPRKTLATRCTVETEPGNYVRVTAGILDTIVDGTNSKVEFRTTWAAGELTPTPSTVPVISNINITPDLPPRCEVLSYQPAVRDSQALWDLFEINNVMHENNSSYKVPFDVNIKYTITIEYKDTDNIKRTMIQNPTVSFRKYIPVEKYKLY